MLFSIDWKNLGQQCVTICSKYVDRYKCYKSCYLLVHLACVKPVQESTWINQRINHFLKKFKMFTYKSIQSTAGVKFSTLRVNFSETSHSALFSHPCGGRNHVLINYQQRDDISIITRATGEFLSIRCRMLQHNIWT